MSEMSGAARIGTASLAAQGAGAAMQTVGAFYSARSQQMQARLQARLAELNAGNAMEQAKDELRVGQQVQQAIRQKAANVKSAQRVAMGAAGVDLSSETAIALQTSTDYLSELDVNTARANAIQAAWGHRMQAVNFRSQAAMGRAQAAAINPFMSAAGTALGSAGSILGQYQKMQSAGVFI